jgi:hypothetical protein
MTVGSKGPLREIVETVAGPHKIEDGDFSVSLRTVVHRLSCGHETAPVIRDGCRLPKLPRRTRCEKCKPKMIIRVLSLTRPWPFAFTVSPLTSRVAPKRIENRSWPPSLFMVECYLALHAAQGYSEDDREWIADRTGLYVPDRSEMPHSEIFAVCRVEGHVERADDKYLKPGQRPWFFGPYGWVLTDFVKLVEPVKCKGGQKLWRLESRPGVLEAVRASYKRSAAGG